MHTRSITVAGGALAVLLGGSAVAVAAFSPVDGSGAISACYSQKSGALRVVSPGAKCSNGEAPLRWSQTGPAGPAGAAGPAGPAGAPGVLSCADELRIQAAAPAFVLSSACAPAPTPSPSATQAPSLQVLDVDVPAVVAVGSRVTGAVELSGPVSTDTTVTLTSSDDGVLRVSGGVVPAGSSRGQLVLDGISSGAADITATYNGTSAVATVEVDLG